MKDTILDDIQTSDRVVGELGRRGGKYFTTQFHQSKEEAEVAFEGLIEYFVGQ